MTTPVPERWSSLLAAASPRGRAPAGKKGPFAALGRHPWVGIGILATIAFVLGVVGSLRQAPPPGPSSPRFLHAVYNSLRNFPLNGDAAGDLPWQLDAARFLAPLATVWAAIAAGLSLTAARRHVARALRSSGHTVVCGLGAKGSRLARESLAAGETVVAIEREATLPVVAELRDAGAAVLVGDARERSLLDRAGAGRARRVVAALPDDRDGLAVALRVRELAEGERPSPRPPSEDRVRCHLHAGDPDLSALAVRHRLLADPSDAFDLRTFGREDAAARLLAVDHLPEALGAAARAGRPAHVAVVGTGATAEACLLRALQAPHAEGPAALRLSIVGPDATAWSEGLARRHHLLRAANGVRDLCALAPVDLPAGRASEVAALLEGIHAREPLDAILLAPDDDALATRLALAARALAGRGVPVLVRVRDDRGLRDVLSAGGLPVSLFGSDDETCSRAVVVDEALDAFARRIHDAYRNQRLAESGGKVDAAQVPWESLDPDLVRSNLAQADHVPMKLAASGRRAERGAASADDAFSAEEVEVLARLEHARWLAERILAGWTFTKGPKDVAARKSPSLLEWADLTEPIRDYDREPVRKIHSQLALLGLRTVRR